jgi:hypothetical protein
VTALTGATLRETSFSVQTFFFCFLFVVSTHYKRVSGLHQMG